MEKNTSLPSAAHPAQCCGVLPCHCGGLCPPLTPCLSCSCCSLAWERFPTVQTHKRTISPGGPLPEVSSHPRLLLTGCYEQLFSCRSTVCLSDFLQIWLNLVKRCYRLRGAKRGNTNIRAMSFVCSFPVIFFHCVLNKRNSYS